MKRCEIKDCTNKGSKIIRGLLVCGFCYEILHADNLIRFNNGENIPKLPIVKKGCLRYNCTNKTEGPITYIKQENGNQVLKKEYCSKKCENEDINMYKKYRYKKT